MTGYDGATYTWNAENRLIAAETADKRITLLYDHMGRRVQKKVFSGTPGSWNAEPDETRVFMYDGWNLIRETVSGTASGETYYVWGLDLSQSMQGAGGIGGLLCAVSGGEVRRYAYDANGNVGQLVNEEGVIVARYEYDPFGNEIVAEGAGAQGNPFRFSTKYLDAETGLVYYGFRYYSAELGRWISRDPIGEKGGLNLYRVVGNNSVNTFDILGMWKATKESRGEKRRLYLRTDNNDTLDTLADLVGLDKGEKQKWVKIEDSWYSIDKKSNFCRVSVPNVWIVANLMHGGDLVDQIIGIGGKVGRSYSPKGVKIVKEHDIRQIANTINTHSGYILGFVMYAHGDEFGFIYNTANWLWGRADRIHTFDVLHAIDQNGFKISEAHPKQCYSIFSGTASLSVSWDIRTHGMYHDLQRLNLNPNVTYTYDNAGNIKTSTMTMTVDWAMEWQKRVVKPVDGYVGMNFLGFDTN
ncbi:hypothetical protein DENIS_4458 [Desulfonema ishimotonii]|uniref:Teneurin-like YD-shell domain-containing protein n=2 Tax=Desulfonema ishimotonii TaxID=45657 RepID=A0A401G2K8_9BACT|nr:hypothetical protein DENIS_4458 [Desulfonema ishimotonii]